MASHVHGAARAGEIAECRHAFPASLLILFLQLLFLSRPRRRLKAWSRAEITPLSEPSSSHPQPCVAWTCKRLGKREELFIPHPPPFVPARRVSLWSHYWRSLCLRWSSTRSTVNGRSHTSSQRHHVCDLHPHTSPFLSRTRNQQQLCHDASHCGRLSCQIYPGEHNPQAFPHKNGQPGSPHARAWSGFSLHDGPPGHTANKHPPSSFISLLICVLAHSCYP
jgi:hypothetical protein